MMNSTNNCRKQLFWLLIFLILFSLRASAQILDPVKWSYGAKKTAKNEAVIFLKATIDDGWHIYSTRQKDGGPVKTTFTFTPAADYVLVGKLTEPAAITHYEKSFEMAVHYFEHTVIFQQKIHLKKGEATIKGNLEYMVCNDHQCLPPADLGFSIPVN